MAGSSTKQTTAARKAALLAALERTLGVVTPACELVGCSREVYYLWMDADPVFRAAVEKIADKLLDFGESKFLQLIENGDTAATLHFMKTKGRKRGYIEQKDDKLPGPEESGRKLVVMSLRRRTQQPPTPPEASNLPAIIP